MSSNDQEYHPGDYDNDNADSPTWRGILRKTNSKINLNDWSKNIFVNDDKNFYTFLCLCEKKRNK